jgi:hypothetical protein
LILALNRLSRSMPYKVFRLSKGQESYAKPASLTCCVLEVVSSRQAPHGSSYTSSSWAFILSRLGSPDVPANISARGPLNMLEHLHALSLPIWYTIDKLIVTYSSNRLHSTWCSIIAIATTRVSKIASRFYPMHTHLMWGM